MIRTLIIVLVGCCQIGFSQVKHHRTKFELTWRATPMLTKEIVRERLWIQRPENTQKWLSSTRSAGLDAGLHFQDNFYLHGGLGVSERRSSYKRVNPYTNRTEASILQEETAIMLSFGVERKFNLTNPRHKVSSGLRFASEFILYAHRNIALGNGVLRNERYHPGTYSIGRAEIFGGFERRFARKGLIGVEPFVSIPTRILHKKSAIDQRNLISLGATFKVGVAF